MFAKKTKNQTKQYVDPNPVETFKNMGGAVAQPAGQNVLKESASDFWKQIVGERQALSGDLQEGQDLQLPKLESRVDVEPGIDYRREIIHGDRRLAYGESQQLQTKIQEILVELKKLVSSSQELEIKYREVVVEQRIAKPGKYHESFFTWMLNIIRAARTQIESSGIWLASMHSKKNKKQSQKYWQMFKDHGTTFGLSNERVVATQTG